MNTAMGQALYRKYRSKSFQEVVGQHDVTDTLTKAIKKGRISHAYLFTGPRGVGKTSVARILAHEINGLPYDPEANHLDIIEIDAASNRRIDEVRNIREKVHIAPASAKFKVYIIDEAHMLTREAFNALLKTLEEPPEHCVFVLATTEAHKLPDTIISRTQRFNFKPVTIGEVARHLAEVADKERIKAEPAALQLLAKHGEGSVRDSLSLLDQLSGRSNTISEDMAHDMLGLPPAGLINDLVGAVENGKSEEIIRLLDKLWDQGANSSLVSSSLSKRVREKLLEKGSKSWMTSLLKDLLEVAASSSPQDLLEISLLEAASRSDGKDKGEIKAQAQAAAELSIGSPPSLVTGTPPAVTMNKKKPRPSAAQFDLGLWPEVIKKAKKEAASLHAAVKLAKPQQAEDGLVLAFEFPLHQKKISTAENINILKNIIEDVCGLGVKIRCVVEKEAFQKNDTYPSGGDTVSPSNTRMQAISNIFGPAEMLESKNS